MSPSTWLFLGTCVTAGVGLVGIAVTLLSSRSQTLATVRAEAAKTSVEQSVADVENLRKIIEALSEQLARVEAWRDEAEEAATKAREECESCRVLRRQIEAENRQITRLHAVCERRVEQLKARVAALEADRG